MKTMLILLVTALPAYSTAVARFRLLRVGSFLNLPALYDGEFGHYRNTDPKK